MVRGAYGIRRQPTVQGVREFDMPAGVVVDRAENGRDGQVDAGAYSGDGAVVAGSGAVIYGVTGKRNTGSTTWTLN